MWEHLWNRPCSSDNSVNKMIRTCRCPVSFQLLLSQKIRNRPRIIDIFMISKDKSVIPLFHCLLLRRKSKTVQCLKNFRLRKTKTLFIAVGCSGNYFQIIQIRKNRFLGHPCNTCHNSTFQIWICLKCRVEQTTDKSGKFIPVSAYICLLHRGVILIQKQNDFSAIISFQITSQFL